MFCPKTIRSLTIKLKKILRDWDKMNKKNKFNQKTNSIKSNYVNNKVKNVVVRWSGFFVACASKKKIRTEIPAKKSPEELNRIISFFFGLKIKLAEPNIEYILLLLALDVYIITVFHTENVFRVKMMNDDRRKLEKCKKENPKFRQGFPMTNSCWWDIKHAQKPIWNCCESESWNCCENILYCEMI